MIFGGAHDLQYEIYQNVTDLDLASLSVTLYITNDEWNMF